MTWIAAIRQITSAENRPPAEPGIRMQIHFLNWHLTTSTLLVYGRQWCTQRAGPHRLKWAPPCGARFWLHSSCMVGLYGTYVIGGRYWFPGSSGIDKQQINIQNVRQQYKGHGRKEGSHFMALVWVTGFLFRSQKDYTYYSLASAVPQRPGTRLLWGFLRGWAWH